MDTITVSARGLGRSIGRGPTARDILADIDLDLGPGLTAIIGPSGSGKSTLLFCLAGLDRPTSGEVSLGGSPLAHLRAGALARLHREQVGFVFQAYNLIPYLSARRNAALPGLLAGRRDALDRADAALARLGLSERSAQSVGRLSGGEQQRVALARVLASRPRVIFADEPTGALDQAASAQVMDLLRAQADEGASVVLVTHDPACADRADRVVALEDGRIIGSAA